MINASDRALSDLASSPLFVDVAPLIHTLRAKAADGGRELDQAEADEDPGDQPSLASFVASVVELALPIAFELDRSARRLVRTLGAEGRVSMLEPAGPISG